MISGEQLKGVAIRKIYKLIRSRNMPEDSSMGMNVAR